MNQNQNNEPKNDGPKNRQSLLVLLICIMISLVCINLLSRMTRNMTSEISYSEFIEMLENGEIDAVTFTSASTVRGFTGVIKDVDYGKIRAVCIGEQTAAEAEKHGMQVRVADRASMDAMTKKVVELFGKEMQR